MSLTASASLKLDKVLEAGLKAFKRRFVSLLAFSTRFQAEELAKDKSLQVPYVGLEASASVDWNPANGYTDANFAIGNRAVPVDKRKFQALSWNSGDLLGLPQESLNWAMEQKTDKLAFDVVTDILSVVTIANYGAAIHTELASAFTPDDIVTISRALDVLNWPEVGRAAVLHQDYVGALQTDVGLKYAQNAGNDDALRRGKIGQISNIDIQKGANFPTNAENTVGVVAMPSAVLIAAAPVTPDAEVMDQLQDFRKITDKETGLTLVYRAWGNADMDKCKRIVEFSYGYAKGDTAQLKRIQSAAL
jgi:hypothetical protein